MISLKFYIDEDYSGVIGVLKEGGLFDEVWETKENLKNKIERDAESIIVAKDNSKIVGCIFIMEDGRNAFIWRLAVKSEYRKQGIGKMLMQEAEEIVKNRGIKEIGGFVDITNKELQKRYSKQDYIQGSDFKFIYKKL